MSGDDPSGASDREIRRRRRAAAKRVLDDREAHLSGRAARPGAPEPFTGQSREDAELALIEAVARGWPAPPRLLFVWLRVTDAVWWAIAVNALLWIASVREGIDFTVAFQLPFLVFVFADFLRRRIATDDTMPRRRALGRRAFAVEIGLSAFVATPPVLITALGFRPELLVLIPGFALVAVLVRPATTWPQFVAAPRQPAFEATKQRAGGEPEKPYPNERGDLVFLGVVGVSIAGACYAFLPYEPQDGPWARAIIPLLVVVGTAAGLWRGLAKIRALEIEAEQCRAAAGERARPSAERSRRPVWRVVLPVGSGSVDGVLRALLVLGGGALAAEHLVHAPLLPYVAAGAFFLLDRAVCAAVRRRRHGGRPERPPHWSSPATAEVARSFRTEDRRVSVSAAILAIAIGGAGWWLAEPDGLAATHPSLVVLTAAVVGVAATEWLDAISGGPGSTRAPDASRNDGRAGTGGRSDERRVP